MNIKHQTISKYSQFYAKHTGKMKKEVLGCWLGKSRKWFRSSAGVSGAHICFIFVKQNSSAIENEF
jgi:hypothetical protein